MSKRVCQHDRTFKFCSLIFANFANSKKQNGKQHKFWNFSEKTGVCSHSKFYTSNIPSYMFAFKSSYDHIHASKWIFSNLILLSLWSRSIVRFANNKIAIAPGRHVADTISRMFVINFTFTKNNDQTNIMIVLSYLYIYLCTPMTQNAIYICIR